MLGSPVSEDHSASSGDHAAANLGDGNPNLNVDDFPGTASPFRNQQAEGPGAEGVRRHRTDRLASSPRLPRVSEETIASGRRSPSSPIPGDGSTDELRRYRAGASAEEARRRRRRRTRARSSVDNVLDLLHGPRPSPLRTPLNIVASSGERRSWPKLDGQPRRKHRSSAHQESVETTIHPEGGDGTSENEVVASEVSAPDMTVEEPRSSRFGSWGWARSLTARTMPFLPPAFTRAGRRTSSGSGHVATARRVVSSDSATSRNSASQHVLKDTASSTVAEVGDAETASLSPEEQSLGRRTPKLRARRIRFADELVFDEER